MDVQKLTILELIYQRKRNAELLRRALRANNGREISRCQKALDSIKQEMERRSFVKCQVIHSYKERTMDKREEMETELQAAKERLAQLNDSIQGRTGEPDDERLRKIHAMEDENAELLQQFIERLEKRLEELDSMESKVVARSGVRPIRGHSVGSSLFASAMGQWRGAIQGLVNSGMTRPAALKYLDKTNPGLRERVIHEANQNR